MTTLSAVTPEMIEAGARAFCETESLNPHKMAEIVYLAMSSASPKAPSPVAGDVVEALKQLISFVSVMVGRGPDCIIPETIDTPLGVPVKIGAIMHDAKAALEATLIRSVDAGELEQARQQGQDEGFAAAVAELRAMSGNKPTPSLAAEANQLADSLEQSRIPCAALDHSRAGASK